MLVYKLQLFAPVRVGERWGYAFVDTGAGHSRLLTPHAAPYERLEPRQSRGALGTMRLERCSVPSVTFLDRAYRDLVVDIQSDFSVDPPPKREVSVCAGQDVLTREPLHLDFEARELGFRARDTLPKAPAQTLPFRRTGKVYAFEMQLGGAALPTLFDTGAGISLLNARYLEDVNDLETLDSVDTTDTSGTVQSLPVYRHPRPEVAGVPWGGFRFLVADLSAVERAANATIGMIYGFEALSRYNWLINWNGEELLKLA